MSGTLLALDWGQKKVGFATADGDGIVISPRGSFKRKAQKHEVWMLHDQDVKELTQIIEEYEAETLVLGMPMLSGGRDSPAAESARAFAQVLSQRLERPVELVNEALTSWEARRHGNDKHANEDAQAAALLLEDYFSARRRAAAQKGFSLLSALVTLVLIGLLGLGIFAYPFLFSPMKAAPGTFVLDVAPGTSFSGLRESFARNGVEIPRYPLKAWLWLSGSTKRTLRVGEYLLSNQASPAQAYREILAGHPLLRKVSVKEGYNIYDIQKEITTVQGAADGEAFLRLVRHEELLAAAGVPAQKVANLRSLEGFLFPETYALSKYDSPIKIVKNMIEEFKRRALPILQSHPWGQSPEGLYRLLILASIVEKESGNKEEQPLVASVFWNRLHKKMRLQSDPTTIYGLLPNFDGNIHKKDLLSPSPFNTYTLSELPATPISNPGETALRAVVAPAATKYLYFVARGDGTHVFSEDYATHNRYVDEYQRKRRNR